MKSLHKSSVVESAVIDEAAPSHDWATYSSGGIHGALRYCRKIWPSIAMNASGAVTVLMLSLLFLSVSCINCEGCESDGLNGKVITVEGIVSDGHHRVFEYSVTCKAGVYALDVVELRGVELGKIHVVSGVLEEYGEVLPEWGISRVLTEVSIDGVRIQTHNEWSEESDLDTEELIEYMIEHEGL